MVKTWRKESLESYQGPLLIPGSGRFFGEGNGNPLQYSCLENLMDRGAWLATVHGISKNWTRLSEFTSFLKGGDGRRDGKAWRESAIFFPHPPLSGEHSRELAWSRLRCWKEGPWFSELLLKERPLESNAA